MRMLVIISLIQSAGTFYICGRDHQYRPIIVADLTKLDKKDIDLIVPTLVYLM